MPRLVSGGNRDQKTGRLTRMWIEGSPGMSELVLEPDLPVGSLRVSIKTAHNASATEIVLDDVRAVRALRDACIMFLDSFEDGHECG